MTSITVDVSRSRVRLCLLRAWYLTLTPPAVAAAFLKTWVRKKASQVLIVALPEVIRYEKAALVVFQVTFAGMKTALKGSGRTG